MSKTAGIIISVVIYVTGLLFGTLTADIATAPDEPVVETTGVIDRSHDSTKAGESTAILDETTAAFETIAETEPETTIPETETTVPETTKAPETAKAEPEVKLVNIISPINAGEIQTLTIKGRPDTEYTLKVRYSTGFSSAKGLGKAKTDANGKVAWSWKVGIGTDTQVAKAEIYKTGRRSPVETFDFSVMGVD